MNFGKIKHKLKHIIKGDQKVYCIAIGNFNINSGFSLFYDFDFKQKDLHFSTKLFRAKDIAKKISKILDTEVIINITKHGSQFMTYPHYSLNEVFNCFKVLKQNYKTDYYWSVPLWLRISPKFNEFGIISPKPITYIYYDNKVEKLDDIRYSQFINQFPLKKLYTTWD